MSETNRKRRNTETSRASSARNSASRSSSSGGRSGQSSADRILAVQNARNRGSETGNRRSTASSRRRGKRRRQGPDVARVLLILIGIVILLICIAVGVKGCSKGEDDRASQTEETTTEPETEMEAEITIQGVSVHGLTKTKAKEKVLESIGWDMKVSFEGETKSLPNLLESKVDAVIDEAFAKGETGTYTVDGSGLSDQIKAQADAIASGWDVSPKNGSISSYDSASGEFVFSEAVSGRMIDREKLAADITAAITEEKYDRTIPASADPVEPEITAAEAKANFKRLGTFTTTTTSNKDRNENIRLASTAINGIIVQPGEEFSFNLTTGNRTTAKGYRAAGAYVNGVLVEEPGGGVCQVSSTLYNAVVFAGLKTTERHAHSYEPSYVTPGEDAMVSYDGYQGPDMKFRNNSKTAVGIKTSFSNQKLTVSIYGNPILEEGVTLSMKSEKVKVLDPPEPEYVEDQTLQLDEEVEVKAATPGSRWVTNLVTKKNGEVVEEVLLHNSTYNGKPATIKRNTSGVVIPTEGESSSESVSESASESDSGAEIPSTEPSSPATPSTQPTTQNPGEQGPGFDPEPNETTEKNHGPGDVILPQPSESGPRDYGNPNVPGDSNGNPSGGDGTSQGTGTAPVMGQPETSKGPSEVGMIAPMG